ncbi:MAG TPA: carboxypeptidase-like regulatory domain-containing protein, partial [Chitinophaga sp.]
MQKCLRLLPLLLVAMAWLCPVIAAVKPAALSTGNAYYQLEELTLKNVFRQTEDRFGISIAYKSELVKSRKVKLDLLQYHSPEEVLQKALAPFNLSYEKVRDRFYLVTEKRATDPLPTPALPLIQQRTLHGKVTDKNSAPLPGVTIKVKGTSNGTLTNAEGHYTLGISGNGSEILQASYVGYETQELPAGTNDELNITLRENTSSLNEVVVTGYTSQRKKDLTGAVTVVKVADMNKQPTAQIENQLQGQASGVTVIGSGQPGQAPMVRIRGVNTFGNNTPLYVVDGVPTQNINDLNPNDVATMQVLKDAGAASIYGSRASNGVIIITTKRGSGKVKVQYDAYYGRQYPKGGNVWHTLNPQEMANLRWMAYHNSGISNPSDTLYGSGQQPVLPDYLLPVGLKEGDPRTNPSLYNVNPNYTDADDYNNFYRITKA